LATANARDDTLQQCKMAQDSALRLLHSDMLRSILDFDLHSIAERRRILICILFAHCHLLARVIAITTQVKNAACITIKEMDRVAVIAFPFVSESSLAKMLSRTDTRLSKDNASWHFHDVKEPE